MKLFPLTGLLALACLLPLALTPAPASAGAPAASAPASKAGLNLAIDGGHSSVVFRIKHMDTSWFYGRFNRIAGGIILDEGEPSKSKASIMIIADSVDTNDEKRDQHVKGPDFLDVKQFPMLNFTSKAVEKTGDRWRVTGELELHGTKKEVAVDFEKTGEGKARGGERLVGFLGTFTIDRTDFGIEYGIGALGKEIEVTISLETKES